jgi:hypothetical protein
MMRERPDEELDHAELSRRQMSDIEELLVDFQVGMVDVIGGMHAAKDAVQMDAQGLVPRRFGDNDLLKLADALFLPELGGNWFRNGQRQASPTFTKASLELAIEKGDLAAIWKHNKWHVTPMAVRTWASQSEPKATKSGSRKSKIDGAYGYKAPSVHDRLDKREGNAAVAAAIDQMDALDAMLKSRKAKKGSK